MRGGRDVNDLLGRRGLGGWEIGGRWVDRRVGRERGKGQGATRDGKGKDGGDEGANVRS